MFYSRNNGGRAAEHAEAGAANDGQLLRRCLRVDSAQMEQAECGKCGRGRPGDDPEECGRPR